MPKPRSPLPPPPTIGGGSGGDSGAPATSLPSAPSAGPGARTLDWRWVAALLLLWLGLTALYELGLRDVAVGFAVLIAVASVFMLGQEAMAEVVTLVQGAA